MLLTYDGLIDNELVKHAKLTVSTGEILSYYIDKTYGWENLDRYTENPNGSISYVDTIRTFNIGHDDNAINFIRNMFQRLDPIIDLDFFEMSHNNGSMLDIYHINYSSHFSAENVIGQAIPQRSTAGGWWDVFWKDSPLINGKVDHNSDLNTIIHEIGHTLGLKHPYGNPTNPLLNSSDTIMSYNQGNEGWNTWFSSNDLDALKKIWGRENDKGIFNFDNESTKYSYKKSSDSYFIKSEIGYEEITNLELLMFKDKTLSIKDDVIEVFDLIKSIDDISGRIYRLYTATFSRFPDKDGLNYWIEKHTSGVDSYRDIAASFIISNEFSDLYGDLSNENYISSLYENILERSFDIEGYNYWLNQLNNGYEDRTEILMGFAESNENKILFSEATNLF